MGNLFQQGPSIQDKETKFFQAVGALPIEQQNFANIVDIAAKQGLPNPPKAAQVWLKEFDAHNKRLKESLPGQPTGTVPLDVPMANVIAEMTGGKLNYRQPAPIPAPLGMQGDLPMGIEDLLASLPQDFQLPSPIQGQQPALSFFGPQALGELPQQVTQPYISSDIPQNVMSALTRQPDIASFPSGTETRTVLRNPITGLPMGEDIATAPRQILTPEQEAFSKLTPEEQKDILKKSLVNIDMGQPPPPTVQETVSGALSALGQLDTMETYIGETGRVKGLWSKAGAWIGTNEDAIKFESARNNMKLAAQSIVKGIPSNFDVQTVIDTLPALWLPQAANKQRIKVSREITKNVLYNAISFYKNTNQSFPPQIVEQAKSFGINVDNVPKWDGKGDPLLKGKVPVRSGLDKKANKKFVVYADGSWEYAE